jgi:hypothetical protein
LKPPAELPLSWAQVRAFRSARLGLTRRAPPEQMLDVVRQTCGIQAQVPSAADLQLGLRIDGIAPDAARRGLWADRTLVRTWCMRGTLHLLTADDLPNYVAALRTHDRWWKGAWPRPSRGRLAITCGPGSCQGGPSCSNQPRLPAR